jgi:hypothetical protein
MGFYVIALTSTAIDCSFPSPEPPREMFPEHRPLIKGQRHPDVVRTVADYNHTVLWKVVGIEARIAFFFCV